VAASGDRNRTAQSASQAMHGPGVFLLGPVVEYEVAVFESFLASPDLLFRGVKSCTRHPKLIIWLNSQQDVSGKWR